MFDFSLMSLLAGIPGLIISMVVHEYAHARMAVTLGDFTPKLMGRLTLDPRAHIDPVGLLMLFLVRFGWAVLPDHEYDVDVLDARAVEGHFSRFHGTLIAQLPASALGIVKRSFRYIVSGSCNSPILNAGVGATGVSSVSTFWKTSSKSRRMSVRTFEARP